MDEHSSDTANFHKSPGQLLKQAREAQALSIAEVAQKMRLSAQVVKDIEHDDYQHIGAVIYVRGYLRSYAKLVSLEEDTVLSAFDELGYSFTPDKIHIPLDPLMAVTTITHRRRNFMRWATIAMAVLLIGLVVIWWNGQRDHANSAAAPSFALQSQPISVSDLQSATTAPVSQTAAKPASKPVAKKKIDKLKKAIHANYKITPINNE